MHLYGIPSLFCQMHLSVNVKPIGICTALLYGCFVFFNFSCTGKLIPVLAEQERDSVSYIVLGDWGVDGRGHQLGIAQQIDFLAQKFNAQFIITAGDNFYPKGVESTTDPQWQTSFENIYNKKGHNIPWYPTLGNHDYGANPEAQVAYSAVSNRWKMPARYYAVEKEISDSNKALFVFTDTSPFLRSYHRRTMADLKVQDTALQLRWLRQTLTESNHKWKIVIGHHPIFSSGEHGNTPELIQRFNPLLQQSKTDFYLCGHDHILEHLQRRGEGMHYLVSGGGGAGNYALEQKTQSRFAQSSPGFLVMTLYPSKANFYFFNDTGRLLYQKQVVK